MPSVLVWVASKPKPPNNQRFPFLSVQAMAKSLPPGVFVLEVANGGDAMGVPTVQLDSEAVPYVLIWGGVDPGNIQAQSLCWQSTSTLETIPLTTDVALNTVQPCPWLVGGKNKFTL